MDSELLVVGRFFKVLMPGFEKELKLPPAFVKTLNKVDLNSKQAVLKSCKGSWTVGVRKCKDGLLHFFGERWKDYVSDHELKTRDFIVFEHSGDFHFNTVVFNYETGCEKDFATLENEEDNIDGLEHVEDIDGIQDSESERKGVLFINCGAEGGGEDCHFQKTIAKYNLRGFVNVPITFARSNGMRQRGIITLRNVTGDSWHATLCVYNVQQRNRIRERVWITCMLEFFKENKVKVGDTCIFKLDHSSGNAKHVVIDVSFVRRP